jgi:SsrA-binding protein
MYLIASIIAVFLSYMNIITTNKHAYHDYRILQTRDAGIVLHGHEVKSLRVNRADISKGIVTLSQKKCKLTNLDIRLYNKTSPQMIA